jgi:protein-arginine kinase activator protein McsA
MGNSGSQWICQSCGVDRATYTGTLVKKTSGEVLCLECDLDEEDPDDNFEENIFEIECPSCGKLWLNPEEPENEHCLDCWN